MSLPAEVQRFENELNRLFTIFAASEAAIRPHFILTGPSGTGKSWNIARLADKFKLGFVEINAAQLTKEGTSGNSLTKAMVPLATLQNRPTICFVDEFDKLFISGNSNEAPAHESTNGVQNEFLKVLEADTASIFGDFGKYSNISVKNVLFVFAGAFNGEEDIDLDRLREIGLKTEFLGRVGLVFNTTRITLESLVSTMEESFQLDAYLKLFPKVKREDVVSVLTDQLTESYEENTLGYRIVNTLINQYFIKGETQAKKEAKKVTFQRVLDMNDL